MNYTLAYRNLIDRARTRVLEGYVERHHVIPRCLKGSDNPYNIVSLTPEEHYLAHLLLVKIHPNSRGLLYAVKLMSGQGNNKSYGWVKRKLSETGFTPEHRKAMSESQKARAKVFPRIKKIKIKSKPVSELTKQEYIALLHERYKKRLLRQDRIQITAILYSIS